MHWFVIRWDGDRLDARYARASRGVALGKLVGDENLLTGLVELTRDGLPELARYDPQRFVAGATQSLVAVLDRFGQVAVFDRAQRLVAMFLAYKGQVAAWLPDGTRYGPPGVTGGPPTPGGPQRIARVLRQAEAGGRVGS